jgi:hypothetical protein
MRSLSIGSRHGQGFGLSRQRTQLFRILIHRRRAIIIGVCSTEKRTFYLDPSRTFGSRTLKVGLARILVNSSNCAGTRKRQSRS